MQEKPVTLFLIRHGRQSSRLCNVNVDLDSAGIRQAELLGARLKNAGIEQLYSSHLKRAVQTAAIVNRSWQVDHVISEDLREISFGEMEGKSHLQINKEYPLFQKEAAALKTDLAYPGGECAADVITRVMPVLYQIVENGQRCIAIVTHGGVIRSVVAHCLGLDLSKVRMLGKRLENSSITQLEYEAQHKRFLLERFNDFAHLEAYPELLRKNWVE